MTLSGNDRLIDETEKLIAAKRADYERLLRNAPAGLPHELHEQISALGWHINYLCEAVEYGLRYLAAELETLGGEIATHRDKTASD